MSASRDATARQPSMRWTAVTVLCVRMDRDGVRTARAGRAHEDRRVRQRAKLAAGTQDIPSFALADVGLQPVPGQDRLEAQHAFIGGPPVRVARKFVEWDQVDLAAEPPQ